MKRRTQTILYHLLPVVFWLLAIGGSILFDREWPGYVVALTALLCVLIIDRIKRHTSSVEECFQVALLLGVVSYWLPTVLFLILPIWGYLIYQNLFSLRSFFATVIGLAAVAVWYGVFYYLSLFTYPLSLTENAWGWIPTGAFLFAWLASTIARRILRVR